MKNKRTTNFKYDFFSTCLRRQLMSVKQIRDSVENIATKKINSYLVSTCGSPKKHKISNSNRRKKTDLFQTFVPL